MVQHVLHVLTFEFLRCLEKFLAFIEVTILFYNILLISWVISTTTVVMEISAGLQRLFYTIYLRLKEV